MSNPSAKPQQAAPRRPRPAAAPKTQFQAIGLAAGHYKAPNLDWTPIDLEGYEDNPFHYYKKLLKKIGADGNYSNSQEYIGVVLRVIDYVQVPNVNNYAKPFEDKILDEGEKFDQYLKRPSPEELANILKLKPSDINQKIYQIAIPELDRCVPFPTHFDSSGDIDIFYSDSSRLAIFTGDKKTNIHAGYLVKVYNVIDADKQHVPCFIRSVISDKKEYPFELPSSLSEEDRKACTDALNTDIPKIIPTMPKPADIKPPPEVPKAILTSSPIPDRGDKIGSELSRDKTKEQSPKLLKMNISKTPVVKEKTPEELRKEYLDAINNKIGSIEACKDKEAVATPEKAESPKSPPETSFLKDGIRDENTKIEIRSEKVNILKAYKLNLSKEVNSSSPAIETPPELRNISMILVKEAPYVTMVDYMKAVRANKQHAAHFCIDEKGMINQLTDTCNLVKSFNPTIDEACIQIAVLNISYKNSKKTNFLLSQGIRPQKGAHLDPPAIMAKKLDLGIRMLADEGALWSYYRFKGIIRPRVNDELLMLNDREVMPNYRLGLTDDQKKSLRALVKSIIKAYGKEVIEPKMPEGIKLDLPPLGQLRRKTKYPAYGKDADVLSGRFSGIITNYHFQDDNSGIFDLYDILLETLAEAS